jgi:hypothetical protein
MRSFLVAGLLILLSSVFGPVFGQWPWIQHTVDQNIDSPAIAKVGDIDGDGDLDMAATSFGPGFVYWYRNNGPDTAWTRDLIDFSMQGAVGLAIKDVDQDDTLDIVAGAGGADRLVWYKNGGGTPIEWTPNTIASDVPGLEVVYVEDVDGDDDMDVVACVRNADQLRWYENEDGAGTAWGEWIIDPSLHQCTTCHVADIDNDGDMDVVACGTITGQVAWYENVGGSPIGWAEHVIDMKGASGAFFVDVGDIDGDNHLDVAATGFDQDDVVWYKNNLPDTNWTKHAIDDSLERAFVLYIADVDTDLDLDILATGRYHDDVVWYENPTWTKHWIDASLGQANNVIAANMDDDNDLDAIVTSWEGRVVWYESFLEPEPYITVWPTSIDFGAVWIGSDATSDFTVTNGGSADLEVTDISSTEPAFAVNMSSFTLSPGSEQEVEVTFTPADTVAFDGMIEITHNASGSPYCLMVTGEGVEPVGVDDGRSNTVPSEIVLYQNYPNPFKSMTEVRYHLPRAGSVLLQVSNLLGEVQVTLVNEEKPEGTYEVEFDAATLASGVYSYKLRAGSFVETKKMVLMK